MILLDVLEFSFISFGIYYYFKNLLIFKLWFKGGKNLGNAKYFGILQRFMFNSNAANEPYNRCLIPFPVHVLQGLHKSHAHFFKNVF